MLFPEVAGALPSIVFGVHLWIYRIYQFLLVDLGYWLLLITSHWQPTHQLLVALIIMIDGCVA